MRFVNLILSIMFICAVQASAQSGPTNCKSLIQDIPIKSIVASASFWSNLRSKPGSINFESNTIFHEAKGQSAHLEVPYNLCPKGCALPSRAIMFFRSTPKKFLSDYSDSQYCNAKLKETSAAPYKYTKPEIYTIEELNSWISDLSQGDGDDGDDLYERCDKSCSPQFEYYVSKNDSPANSYSVHASIICGPARDKDDNLYDLQAFFRWQCK